MLNGVLGQQPGMERGAASHHEYLVDIAQLLIGEPLLVEHYPVEIEVTQQRVGNRRRLFGDLLEHEVLVTALFRGRQIPIDGEHPGVPGVVVALEIGDAVSVRGNDDDLILPQFDSIPGVFDERRDVGPEEHLAVADADNQRRRPARGHDGARVVCVREDESEVSLQPTHDGLHRGDEVTGGVPGFELA
ncbi:Uncharacterised protein [Mycobacteroides abscessus subsp. abscessus]|nr:Uncharacterised protein [Mycobacteroides abscessus subsp. abscessus]